MAQSLEQERPPSSPKALSATADSQGSSSATANGSEAANSNRFADNNKPATPPEKAQSPDSAPAAEAESDEPASQPGYGWRFYVVFAALVLATLLSALDGAIVAVALPTISASLGTGPDYVWVANVYFLTG